LERGVANQIINVAIHDLDKGEGGFRVKTGNDHLRSRLRRSGSSMNCMNSTVGGRRSPTASSPRQVMPRPPKSTLAVGQAVRVRVGQPRIGLGILARTFDDLLKASGARTTEPAAYFVVDGRLDAHTAPPSQIVMAYRKVLSLVALFAKAAAYLDQTRQELVFVHEGRFPPKAEARGSNPFGCAKNIIQTNDLETHVVAIAVREILAEAPRKQFAKSCGEDRRVIVGQYGRHFLGAGWACGKRGSAKEGLLVSPLRPSRFSSASPPHGSRMNFRMSRIHRAARLNNSYSVYALIDGHGDSNPRMAESKSA
jgi:hypothetical protein